MAFPPPTLPTNRTNATPQIDTHPADHNAVNAAVNDTVGAVNGVLASVTALPRNQIVAYSRDTFSIVTGNVIGPTASVTIRAGYKYTVALTFASITDAVTGSLWQFEVQRNSDSAQRAVFRKYFQNTQDSLTFVGPLFAPVETLQYRVAFTRVAGTGGFGSATLGFTTVAPAASLSIFEVAP
jgi:hypothetical protein